MNDDKDMPLNPVGDDALEARIVAWVLGEASSFEAEELERLCTADPALRLFERRMRVLHGLIADDKKVAPDPEWQLPESKREKIAALFAETASESEEKDAVIPIRRNRTGRRALLALAACTVVSLTAWSLLQQVGGSRNYAVASEASVAKSKPSREETELRLEALRKAVIQQEDAVEDKRKLLSQIVRTEGVVYSGDQRVFKGSRGFSAADDAESAARKYAELDQEKIQLESQIETLLKYDGPQLMTYASGLSLPDNVVPNLLPQYQEAKVEYEKLKSSGVGEDHPDMKSRASRLSGMENNLVEATANLRETLKAKLDLNKEQLARLETRVNDQEDDAIKKGIATQSFVDAKHDFESNMRQLEDLKVKLITEEMQAKISEDALAINDTTEFPAGGGAGGGQAASSPRGSSVPQKKPITSNSSLRAKSPFTTKQGAATAAPADAMAAATPQNEAEVLALRDAPAEPMSRAKQDSKEVAELRGLAANEPQSPAARPRPAAMPAQRPAVAGVAGAESELLAKRQQETTALGREPAGPDIATRFRGDLDQGGAVAGKPLTDIVTAGNRSGDGAITRNNIDAILDGSGRMAGEKAGADVDRFAWSSTNEGMKSMSDEFGSAAADGFGGGVDAVNAPMGGAGGGGLKMDLTKDLKPAEVRAKSESFAFDNLDQMGELAQQLPADQSQFGVEFRLGGVISPGQQGRSEVDLYASQVPSGLADLDRKLAEPGIEVTREYRYADQASPELPGSSPGSIVLGVEAAKAFFDEAPLALESKGSAASTGTADATTMIEKGKSEVARKTEEDSLADAPTADPFVSSSALNFQSTPNDGEVRRNLYTAEGHYNLGKYEDAHRAYEEVLRTDPTNKAARRGMEQVAQARSDYYRAAYDQTRAQLLAEVDKSWELTVPPLKGPDGQTAAFEVDKRKSIILPEFDLKNATVEEAVDLLQMRAVELDVAELDPAKKGFKFSLEKPAAGSDQADVAALRIPELKLENVALGDAIKQVAEAAGLEYAYNDAGVILKPGARTPKKSAVTLDAMAEVATSAEPFSTFSLHVSDASFKLAKAALDRGEIPAADGIRPEEFYNAFDYGDPSPANGEPVVCAVEQSAHPAFPQRNLLRIGVKTGSQGRGQSTPLNLTLLLDSSGSMEREDRNAGLANAVQQLSSLLKEGDTITVAGFSRQPRLLADRLPGARAQELNGLIAQTPSEGGTNLEEGLKLGEELAKRQFNPTAQNRVVLFTDGAANLGDARPEALQARVEGLRQQGIAFDAAGFGAEGLNDKLLERLTRNGNGRYYIVDRAEDADAGFAKQLAGAFRPAAENVKVQVRFNPARVAKYKLIGFEEHRLKKEDFRNDAVDAAEMAAEEAGNALYQIEVLPQGEGEVGEVSVRFRDAASGQMVERTWTIPYESQAPAFDQAKPAIQLAGLAAFAAEKLRGAPMADAIDLQQLAPVLAKVKARYANSQPVADLESMIGKLK